MSWLTLALDQLLSTVDVRSAIRLLQTNAAAARPSSSASPSKPYQSLLLPDHSSQPAPSPPSPSNPGSSLPAPDRVPRSILPEPSSGRLAGILPLKAPRGKGPSGARVPEESEDAQRLAQEFEEQVSRVERTLLSHPRALDAAERYKDYMHDRYVLTLGTSSSLLDVARWKTARSHLDHRRRLTAERQLPQHGRHTSAESLLALPSRGLSLHSRSQSHPEASDPLFLPRPPTVRSPSTRRTVALSSLPPNPSWRVNPADVAGFVACRGRPELEEGGSVQWTGSPPSRAAGVVYARGQPVHFLNPSSWILTALSFRC